jgi:large subunit ribosomal protein L25
VSEIKLTAEQRTEFGKGAARRIRRAAKIPAVIYGHGEPPQHVTLPGHETMLALKHSNALLSLTIDGGAPLLALAKDVQRNPVRPEIEHVDLVVVRRGEKVEVEIAVHLTGEAAPETVVTLDHATLLIEAEATDIPETVEVSVEGLAAGTQVHAADVTLPAGTRLVTDPGALVVLVGQARTAEDVEAELSEAEAELGIAHEAPQTQVETPSSADTEGTGQAASGPTGAAEGDAERA